MSTATASPTTEPRTVTRDDIRALGECDRATFHVYEDNSCICLHKEMEKRGPFEPKEREYRIDLRSRVADYDDQSEPAYDRDRVYSCFASVGNYRSSPSGVAALAEFLKPGDLMFLEWVATGNDYTKQHGVHMDYLRVIVRREKRGKSRDYEFHLETSVGPDNTARMIRRR
jgi:hypothetical protein